MNENPKKNSVFTIQNEAGKEIDCEVLFTFDSEETKKSYIIYTDNTTDESGSTRVYASIYDPTGQKQDLLPIETETEWNTIESILSKLESNQEGEQA